MTTNEHKHLIVKVIEYAKDRQVFTLAELIEGLGALSQSEIHCLRFILVAMRDEPNANNIVGIVNYKQLAGPDGTIDQDTATFSLLPSAYFNYIDLQEIKMARENAEFAKANSIEAARQSKRAIQISVLALIASALIGLIQILIEVL